LENRVTAPRRTDQKTFTVPEVARALSVSSVTVYRLVRSGRLPALQVGRSYRVTQEDLTKYLQDRFMDAG
jgi:excisionase family DNA binding protein